MNYADYSTLKAASKTVMKKIAASGDEPEYIVFEKKRYNSSTGAEKPVKQTEISLSELESNKSRLTKEKAEIDAQLTEVNAMITDIKAL